MTLTLSDRGALVLKRHDLLPALEQVILRDGEPADLTGCTVTLVVRQHGADAPIIEAFCDVVDAEAGSIRYQWVDGDTAVAGTYLWELEVIDSDARRETVPADGGFTLRIRPDLNGEDGVSPSPAPDPAGPIPYPIVYATVAAIEAEPGVSVARYAHVLELGEALFKWVVGSAATRDGIDVLNQTGGVGGRWIRQRAQSAALPWSMPLVLDRPGIQTYVGPVVSSLAIALSAARGHVPGTTRVLVIPAGKVTSSNGLRLATELRLTEVDVFDPAADYTLTIDCLAPTIFRSTGESSPSPDITAPTLVSATVRYANQDALELVFDSDVTVVNPAGITLAFSVGTPRTVTAVESGDGTNTLLLTLSGSLAGSDVCTVSIAAQSIQDLNGNWLAPVSAHAVTNQISEPTFNEWILLRGDALGANGSAISSWTGQDGVGPNHGTQPVVDERPLVQTRAEINNQKAAVFDGVDDSLLNLAIMVDGGVPPDITAFTVVLEVKLTDAQAIIISFADATGTEFTWCNIVKDAGTLSFYVADNLNPASAADSSTAWRKIVMVHSGATRDIYIDNVLFATSAVAKNPQALRQMRIARGQAGNYPSQMELAEVRLIPSALNTQQRADLHAALVTRYG